MASEAVLVDTGALAALFDPRDQFHSECIEAAKLLPVGKAFTCWPVLTEAAYLLRLYPIQRESLLRAIEAGEFELLPLDRNDLTGVESVFEKYSDQEIDLADAVLVHLADRENIEVVFTVDRRHFALFRKKNGKPFRLLPQID